MIFAALDSGPVYYILSVVLPLAVSWCLTALLIRLAPNFGLVDLPAARKVHTHPTPKGGGIAIFLSFLAVTLILDPPANAQGWAFLGLATIIAALGLTDDFHPLSWQLRLGIQAIVAVVAVFLLPIGLPTLALPLAVLWIVGMINAFNMLDNMDGLSAGVACVAASLAAYASASELGAPSALPFLVLVGSLLGFLWFNRSPARIFMGDAGSTFLGFFIGTKVLSVDFLDADRPGSFFFPVLLLSVPIYDLATVVTLRLMQGHSPFHADKQHLSHRLVDLGLSKSWSVRVIHVIALATGTAALALNSSKPHSWLLIMTPIAAWWVAFAMVEFRLFVARSGRNLAESSNKS